MPKADEVLELMRQALQAIREKKLAKLNIGEHDRITYYRRLKEGRLEIYHVAQVARRINREMIVDQRNGYPRQSVYDACAKAGVGKWIATCPKKFIGHRFKSITKESC